VKNLKMIANSYSGDFKELVGYLLEVTYKSFGKLTETKAFLEAHSIITKKEITRELIIVLYK
jgi:hypothetical protein